MQFNFFQWLRAGVRQSVLLGVSDAVEQLGLPPEGEGTDRKFMELIGPHAAATAERLPAAREKPRRLGRSLRELQNPAPGAAGEQTG